MASKAQKDRRHKACLSQLRQHSMQALAAPETGKTSDCADRGARERWSDLLN